MINLFTWCPRFNERVLVQEMADSYNSVINTPLSWPMFRGPFTYKVTKSPNLWGPCSYNSVINTPLSWPMFRGPFTYKVIKSPP